jgi:hypothetical protein
MKKIVISGSLFLFPMFAFAQQLSNVTRLISSIRGIVDILIPLVAALALLYFFWGLAKFILATGNGDEDAREKGKNIMIWGIVGLFVIVSVWGLVRFVGDALDIGTPQTQPIPGIGN